MRNLLSIDDLDRGDIERICDRARSFAEVGRRDIKKVPTLRGRTIVSLFYESSTRTSSSFELAAKRLSADVISVKSVGSSVDKGESLRDTIATLSAYEPEAIVIRAPEAGAAALVAGWTHAAVINAGDGKHEHPSQALLDVYTLLERIGPIDEKRIWIVGDVAHSRVARSCIRAFVTMGARVTVAGPPTLIPRGIEALGCDVSYTLDELGEADVVYALRMQSERMRQSFIPSLREYATNYQINSRRLGPRQLVMHPGPVNRGVELSPDVIDGPASLMTAQVASGLLVRMAILYEVLAGGDRPRPIRGVGSAAEASPIGGARVSELRPISSLDWRKPHDGDLVIRGARVLDPRTEVDGLLDLVIRGGEIAEIAEPGGADPPPGAEEIDARGLHAFPAFFDPHVHLRTPGQEYREDIETGTRAAAAGGFCGIVAMANTDPVVDDPALIGALRERAADEASVPTGFVSTVTRGMRGEELTEMAAIRAAGAVGFSDDGLPIVDAGVMRRALQYQHLVGGNILLHEEDPALTGDGVMGEGEVSAALGLAGVPAVSESTMIARDGALCLYEGARAHVQHLSARESVIAVEAAKSAGARLTAELTPHHLALTDEEVRSLDARFKMNPPLRTEDDRQALIAALRSGAVDCIGTDHAPHASNEKDVPFEVANMGVTGLETAFAALYTHLVEPGILELGLIVERMGAGAALFDLEPARIEIGAEADLTLVDLEADWEAGADGWESRSENSCFAGRRLRSRPVVTVVAGSVAYRRREFTMKVAG